MLFYSVLSVTSTKVAYNHTKFQDPSLSNASIAPTRSLYGCHVGNINSNELKSVKEGLSIVSQYS